MARTIEEIQNSQIAAKAANPVLATLDSDSAVAIWRLWTFVGATCMQELETYFDDHKSEVLAIINQQSAHTPAWYEQKVKLFQWGVELPADTDRYPNPSTDPAIAIVQFAACEELPNQLLLKVAKGSPGAFVKLSDAEKAAAAAYMDRVKDAGVDIDLISEDADDLKLKLTVYYDPLVLDSSGGRLDGTAATPVKDAVKSYISSLIFNGYFIPDKLGAALQNVQGVVIAHLELVQANYALEPYETINYRYRPYAGHLKLNEGYFDANITYQPYL